MEEFKDFYKFITAVDSYGMKSGIVKVVPPKEWLAYFDFSSSAFLMSAGIQVEGSTGCL